MIVDLAAVILKNGHTTVGNRILELAHQSKMNQIAGLEAIVSELKTGDLKADTATKQLVKHVYRQMTQ
jgi:hypothetical protein